MKYLNNYIDKATSQALDMHEAFFCFGVERFKEKSKKGITYVDMGMGLVCPKENAKQLQQDLNNITMLGIKEDIKDNGKDGIIKRELNNHEAYYTWDTYDTIQSLKGYGFSTEDVQRVFRAEVKAQEARGE